MSAPLQSPAVRALPGVRHRSEPSGHVFLREGKRGPVWYAKYRLPDGRQVKKRVGPAYTGRGRAPAGALTRRAAEEWLSGVLAEARGGTLRGTLDVAAVEPPVAADDDARAAAGASPWRNQQAAEVASDQVVELVDRHRSWRLVQGRPISRAPKRLHVDVVGTSPGA